MTLEFLFEELLLRALQLYSYLISDLLASGTHFFQVLVVLKVS